MKIGITGQTGFIGRHLYNYLQLQEEYGLVEFPRTAFDQPLLLDEFVKSCDAIVHLAGVNRHEDDQFIYDENVRFAQCLVDACEREKVTPHIIFSSSTQEDRDNEYGRSKRAARELLESALVPRGGKVTGLVIPNVFGPFGKPFYNSVVATFCHQVCRDEEPTIINDGQLSLIYVNELVEEICSVLESGTTGKVMVAARHQIMVSELLAQLLKFKKQYKDNFVFPDINTPFRLALFNTFRCYMPSDHYPVNLTKHTDDRGSFVEIVRANTSGQFSFSTTKPGITRGNHFHTRKAERFTVIQGKASIQIRKVDSDHVEDYILDGDQPSFVDMPIWCTHNITNIGDEELITLFWINEPYDPEDPDTYFVNV